jgi:hypothetical protein
MPAVRYVAIGIRHRALLAASRLLTDWPGSVPAVGVHQFTGAVPFPIILCWSHGQARWQNTGEWWLTYLWTCVLTASPDETGLWPWSVRAELLRRVDQYQWFGGELGLPLEHAAYYCQVSETELTLLVEAGLLPAQGPFPGGRSLWVFCEPRLHAALLQLLGPLPVSELPAAGARVADLAWILTAARRHGVGLAQVLRALGAGVLPAFRTRPSVQLCDVWCEQSQVLAYLERHGPTGDPV